MSKDLLPKHFENISWTDADRNASQLLTCVFRQFAMYMYVTLLLYGIWSYFIRSMFFLKKLIRNIRVDNISCVGLLRVLQINFLNCVFIFEL